VDTEQSTTQDVGIVSLAMRTISHRRFHHEVTKWRLALPENCRCNAKGRIEINQTIYIEQRKTNVEEYMTMESESIRIGVRKDGDIKRIL
jgi:hypothetical protein